MPHREVGGKDKCFVLMHCLEVLCSQFVFIVIFINQDNFPQSQKTKTKTI